MGKDLKGKELGQCLSQMKDGRYVARYTDRHGKRRVIYKKTEKEIRRALTEAQYTDEFGEDVFVKRKQYTLNDVYEEWIKEKAEYVKITTLSSYKMQYSGKIKEVLGDKIITNIDEEDIKRCIRYLFNECNLLVSSINIYKATLSNIFSFAVERKICMSNPCANIKINKIINPKKQKQITKKKFFSLSEINLFLEALDKYRYPANDLLYFVLFTGLRAGEAIALKWEAIDLQNKEFIIKDNAVQYVENHKTYKKYDSSPKTKGSIRVIPMNNQVYNFLKKKSENRNDTCKFVFHSTKNEPLSYFSIRYEMKEIIKKFNKESKEKLPLITPHGLRHSFTTMCFEKDIPPKVVQKFLGHSNIQTTMNIYTHVSNEKLTEEMDKISMVQF